MPDQAGDESYSIAIPASAVNKRSENPSGGLVLWRFRRNSDNYDEERYYRRPESKESECGQRFTIRVEQSAEQV